MSGEHSGRRPRLSVLALLSFVASFLVARMFTTFYPSVIIVGGGIHIHHFWFGIVLQAIGGWLGISYDDRRINRLAAILFGVGGGLIGDEIGLLLTFGNYWTQITYTVVISLAAFASVIILLMRYSGTVARGLGEFANSNMSLYFGIFLATVSIAFVAETNDVRVNELSILLTALAAVVILAHFLQRLRKH
jgi:hypothetical protein